MNYINLFLLFLIAIYILQGFHKGFLVSVANTVGMVVSIIVGFLFSPLLSKTISEGPFFKFLVSFTYNADTLQQNSNVFVETLTTPQMQEVVKSAKVPPIFENLAVENMQTKAFASMDLHTVSDYINITIANVVVNIFAFIIIYILARVFISVMINAVNFASPLPVLKRLDGLAGAGVAFVRAYFDMYVLFLLVPILYISVPVDIFEVMVRESSMANHFYNTNFLFGYIKGVI